MAIEFIIATSSTPADFIKINLLGGAFDKELRYIFFFILVFMQAPVPAAAAAVEVARAAQAALAALAAAAAAAVQVPAVK